MTDNSGLRSGTWTVLFMDVVDSTALRSRLGDDAADALQGRIDTLTHRVTEDHNGLVVKGLGDGSMCAFEGAADAVLASIALQQGVHRINQREAETVEIRIGLAVGDAAAEGDDLFGTPVVEAARLCSKAGSSEIYCTDVTKIVAGSRSGGEFVSVGDLELKGLPDPVATSEIRWEPLEDLTAVSAMEELPLPRLLTSTHRVPFAGREPELAGLEKAWSAAQSGERTTALLSGEPGIGKSRLTAELGRRAHAEGAMVLLGRCDDELGVPFQPFVEALDFFVEHCAPEQLTARLGPHPAELIRLVPGIAELVPDLPPPLSSDAETERLRLFDAVDGWLSALSAETPAVLVLDDLHWAARPTLQLLRHVVRSGASGQLLLVGTYRDTDLDRTSPLTEVLADMRRIPSVARIAVKGLAAEEVVRLIETVAGHDLDADGLALAHLIQAESEGNPFFVGEILRHLSESGDVYVGEDGRWTVRAAPEELGIPEGVKEVVGRRIDQLPDEVGDLLTIAAVIGREFELEVLLALGDEDEDDVIDALDACLEARLIDETGVGRYRFSHALVRSTLYDELRTTKRARLHRRIGEAIEDIHAGALETHLPELAHHFASASSPDSDKAFEYACQAGQRALDQLAHDEAVERFEGALELLDEDSPQRAAVLLGLGHAQVAAGDPAHRQSLLAAGRLARTTGDASTLGQAAQTLHRGYFGSFGQPDTERIDITEAALDAVGEEDSAIRARLLAILANELVFAEPLTRRQELSDEAVAIARRLDDPETLCHVLRVRHSGIWDATTLQERVANTDELGALAERLHDPHLAYWAGYTRWATGIETADLDRAESGLETCRRVGDEARLAIHQWINAFTAAGHTYRAGDLEEAERLANESLEIGAAAGEPDALFYYGVQLFFIRRDQGRLAEIDEATKDAVASLPGVRAVRGMEALLDLDLGRPGQAREALRRLRGEGFDTLPLDQARASGLFAASELCLRLEERELATELSVVLEPVKDCVSHNGLIPLGSLTWALARCLAVMGRTEEAHQSFAAAAEAHDALGAEGQLARLWVDWAETIREIDPQGSAELAIKAADTAARLGMPPVVERAAALKGDRNRRDPESH